MIFDLQEDFIRCCMEGVQSDPVQPLFGPQYFITNYCKTVDPNAGGTIRPIEPYPYVLDYIRDLEETRIDPENLLVDKSRQMTASWIVCAYFLWCTQFTRNFAGFMTTRSERLVDDGGDHSTWKSLFGRVRFMWDQLPVHLKIEMKFAYMRAECEPTGSFITGEAATERAGSSMTYSRALVDEAAHVAWGESLHQSLDPAAPLRKIYQSTHNGPQTVFAKLQKRLPKGWRLHVIDWKDHPVKSLGLAPTPEHEIDRLGPMVSPWFREATDGMSDDQIAQEFNRSPEKSMRGLVFKEFSIARHVPIDPFRFDPQLGPPIVGLDYGATGFGAAVAGQLAGVWSLQCFADYELEGAGGAKEHAKNLWNVLRRAGYEGDIEDVQLIGGPDTNTSQTGSGQTVGGYYRAFGFTRIRESQVRGPNSVKRGIGVVCVSLRQGRITISRSCKSLIDRFGDYRWPVERVTGVIRDTAPVHNEASHIMDAFRYLVSDCFPQEERISEFDTFAPVVAAEPRRSLVDRIDFGEGMSEEDDDMRLVLPVGVRR